MSYSQLGFLILCWLWIAPLPPVHGSTGDGLECETLSFEGIHFDTVWVDLGKVSLNLFWKDRSGGRYRNFSRLKADLETRGYRLRFATNSGIYGEDYRPLGLHIAEGKVLRRLNRSKGGKGNFSLKPNGVFFVEGGRAGILETAEFAARESTPELAVQSGPLLLHRGRIHPKFNAGSQSVYVRNGVGITEEGRVVFAISRRPLNLFTFASLFKNRLDCRDALYLDGALSGMYAPCVGREDVGFDYVGILAVVEKVEP